MKDRKSRFVIELEDVIIETAETEKQLQQLRNQLREDGYDMPDDVLLGAMYRRPDGTTVQVCWNKSSQRYEAICVRAERALATTS